MLGHGTIGQAPIGGTTSEEQINQRLAAVDDLIEQRLAAMEDEIERRVRQKVKLEMARFRAQHPIKYFRWLWPL